MSQYNYIEALASPHYSVRTEAVRKLYECRDIKILTGIQGYFKSKQKEEYTLLFINLLNDMLSEVHEHNTKWALVTLYGYVNKERDPLSKHALNYIETFFSNTDIYNHFKSFVISNAWNELSPFHKLLLTKTISKNKFSYHSGILASNFELADEELHLETIKAFKSLNDRRGNRAISTFIKHSNLELQKEAIETLGNTGNIFEGFSILPYVYSSNEEVATEALISARKLLGNFSCRYLWQAYLKTDSTKIKIVALKQLSYLTNKKAFYLLFEAFKLEKRNDLRIEIEQSLGALKIRGKIKILLKKYSRMSEDEKCRHILLLDSFNSSRIPNFLLSLIQSARSDVLIAFSINLLATYQIDKVEDFLRAKFLDSSSAHSLNAYDALLKIKFKQNPSGLLEDPPLQISLDQPHHALYMKYMSKVSINSPGITVASEYLTGMLRSNNLDNVYTAISTLKFAHDKDSLVVLVTEYNSSSNQFYCDAILNIIRTILYRSSPFIDNDVIAHLPPEVFIELNPFLLSENLLKKFLSFMVLNSSPILEDFFDISRVFLMDKVSNLIIAESDEILASDFFRLAYRMNVLLTPAAENKIKSLYKRHDFLKRDVLQYFLEKKDMSDFKFLVSDYATIMECELSPEFQAYMEVTL